MKRWWSGVCVGMVMWIGILVGGLLGCRSVPRGTQPIIRAGAVLLECQGGGILKADELKTVYRVRCSECGLESFDLTIDTPTSIRPYEFVWNCPKCRRRQPVTIRAVKP